MCSSRWDRPALSSDSKPEPVPIQNPSAADRTEPMCSVTTRTPESSSVRRCSVDRVLVALGIAVRAVPRAPRAARPVAALAAAAAAAVAIAGAARAPVAAAAAAAVTVAARAAPVAAAATGADRGQLLDGLAGDLRVLGEAQADAAALAVDLDDAD